MRGLQVINSLTPGGAEVLLRNMILGFSRRGITCELYLLKSTDSHLQSSLTEHEIRLCAPLRASVYSPLHVLSLAAHLRACSYDIVHAHLFPARLWVALAARKANITAALVTTEHSTFNRRRRRVYRPMDRWIYKQYRSIASISDATTKALVHWLPDVAGKARTCPNGVDVNTLASSPAASKADLFALPQTCPIILSVGRMERPKDYETVIRALSLVQEVHLALVGVGPMLEEHRKLSQKLGVEQRVHFLGRRSDVPRLMKAADIYVQSSRWEGFGIAALEAMASGLPVVATRVPGLAELVGEAGLLFEPGDHRQLAGHLNRLLSSSELRAHLAEVGKVRASNFGLEKTLDCYQALYQELLAG
jgi:glycosyltransferase involved in cell wall biosynthesis